MWRFNPFPCGNACMHLDNYYYYYFFLIFLGNKKLKDLLVQAE